MKMNSHDQYYWIIEHPQFSNKTGYDVKIEITPHMVCPQTNRMEDFDYLNTQMQFWVELSYASGTVNDTWCHDWDLDCGGNTWDEAVDNLYQKVLEKYGAYEPKDNDASVQEIELFNERYLTFNDENIYIGLSKAALDLEFEINTNDLQKEKATLEVLKKYLNRKYADKVQIRIDMDKIISKIQKSIKSLEEINDEYQKIGEVPKKY